MHRSDIRLDMVLSPACYRCPRESSLETSVAQDPAEAERMNPDPQPETTPRNPE